MCTWYSRVDLDGSDVPFAARILVMGSPFWGHRQNRKNAWATTSKVFFSPFGFLQQVKFKPILQIWCFPQNRSPVWIFFVRSKVVFFFTTLWHHLNHGTWQNWRFVWSFNECLDIVRSIFKLVQILCGSDKRWNGDFRLLNLTWCNGLNGHTFYELSGSTHQKSKCHNALLITCWGDV